MEERNFVMERDLEFREGEANVLMDLYSREIATFGIQTMKDISTLTILIIGLKGVGIETAKNVILSGVGSVTLYDNGEVGLSDVGTNFYLNETQLGCKRSESVVKHLRELNPMVQVSTYTGDLSNDFIDNFGCVVITDHLPLDLLKKINTFTHHRKSKDGDNAPIVFLLGLTNGLMASVFSDFGPCHIVTDIDGEAPVVNIIEDITVVKDKEEKPYLIIKVTSNHHRLENDSIVEISGVEGMTELNNLGPTPMKCVYNTIMANAKPRKSLVTHEIRIDAPNIETWGTYLRGGMITELKPSKKLQFAPLSDSVTSPNSVNPEAFTGFVVHPNVDKMFTGRGSQLHFARLALWEFERKNGRLPLLHNKDDANSLVEIAKDILERHKAIGEALVVEEIDEEVVHKTALYCSVELPGLTAFLGGVLAQEVIKKFGKFTPIQQWLHLDYFELLSEAIPSDASPIGSPHDNQIAVFGKAFQDKIGKQRWLIAGCGALGCEYLKGFTLMGLGSNGGMLYATDPSKIKLSNLHRQLLYRRDDIGKFKSQTALEAIKRVHPKVNIEVFDIPVSPETENIFNDTFWNKLDGICNALDNIKAREYTNSKSVLFEKVLLDSGTLGTKASSQIIIPHKTSSWGEQQYSNDDYAFPLSTIKNFPHSIEHCIEYSRSMFDELFISPVESFNQYFKNPSQFLQDIRKQHTSTAIKQLQTITRFTRWFTEGATIECCVRYAFQVFLSEFHDGILRLLHHFPEDAVREYAGERHPFWYGNKRLPKAHNFNPDDEYHFLFIYSCANIYADILRIPSIQDKKEFRRILAAMELTTPQFQLRDNENEEELIGTLLGDLGKVDMEILSLLKWVSFEKDNDTNFHIDFITSCTNLKALNFSIPTATRFKCKITSGRILPAVVTTASMISGLVEMELYKILLDLPLNKILDSNVNLAISSFNQFEPAGPKRAKEVFDPIESDIVIPFPDGWTSWDKVIINQGDITLKELLSVFPSIHFGCTITSIFFKNNSTPLWIDFAPVEFMRGLNRRNIDKKITDLHSEIVGPLQEDKYFIELETTVQTKEGKPASTPPVILICRKLL